MKKVIRQTVGIDCAKDELVVSLGILHDDFEQVIRSNSKFRNTEAGFEKLIIWIKKQAVETISLTVVIEATGVYHERVSLFLTTQGFCVSVILPNRAKAFFKTLPNKTITDKTCGQMLCRLGLEKTLDKWEPPHPVYNTLKQLIRERSQLIIEQTQNKNQLHAEQSGAWVNAQSVKRVEQRLALLSKQLQQIVDEIECIVYREPWLKEQIDRLRSIKGVGLLTAVTVVAETNGFNLIRNKKQLVSYAGLDVKEKTSGASVMSRPKISKAGNSYLRACLFYPSLTAIKNTPRYKAMYARLVSKHGIKKKALVAVQRKMLELMFVLWKNRVDYDTDYLNSQPDKEKGQPKLTLHELT